MIDQLLREQRHEELERMVAELLDRGLLNGALLNAARALDLAPTVIFLATLAVENLRVSGDSAMWLEAYRTLGRRAETEGFKALPPRTPVKWIVRNLIRSGEPDIQSLSRCKGGPGAWVAAFELAVDQRRFDLVEHMAAQRHAQKASVEELLLIVRALIDRRPLLLSRRDTAPLARGLARIRNCVPAVPAMANARSALAAHAAEYFLRAGEYAQSIAMGELVTVSTHQLTRMLTLGEAYCYAGDLPRSIECLDQALRAAGLAHHQDEFRQTRELAELRKQFIPGFTSTSAAKALLALQETLDSRGQKVFLVSGTLLGYAREGQLLAHDKDIDVGIMKWENQFDVMRALLESGQFAVDTRTFGGADTYHIAVKHLATNTDIDVFVYHPEDGKLVTGVQSRFGYLQKFAFTPFELEQVDFLGIKVYVPDDVDRNLAENFGNWRVSDPDYISHLESPSTTDVGGKVYQVVGRLTSLTAIQHAKPAKLRRALHLMDRHRHRECGMSPQLIEALHDLSITLEAERSAPASSPQEALRC